MTRTDPIHRSANIVRWIARLWSIVVFALAILQIVYPDEYASGPITPADAFLLSLWGIAILGLAAAWRWEAPGAAATILTMCLREIAFYLIKGFWIPAFLLVWILVIPPAVMFLAAWMLTRNTNRAKPPKTR